MAAAELWNVGWRPKLHRPGTCYTVPRSPSSGLSGGMRHAPIGDGAQPHLNPRTRTTAHISARKHKRCAERLTLTECGRAQPHAARNATARKTCVFKRRTGIKTECAAGQPSENASQLEEALDWRALLMSSLALLRLSEGGSEASRCGAELQARGSDRGASARCWRR